MKNTGSVYNTVFGEIDASKGMFRVKRLDENLPKVHGDEEQWLRKLNRKREKGVGIHYFFNFPDPIFRIIYNKKRQKS